MAVKVYSDEAMLEAAIAQATTVTHIVNKNGLYTVVGTGLPDLRPTFSPPGPAPTGSYAEYLDEFNPIILYPPSETSGTSLANFANPGTYDGFLGSGASFDPDKKYDRSVKCVDANGVNGPSGGVPKAALNVDYHTWCAWFRRDTDIASASQQHLIMNWRHDSNVNYIILEVRDTVRRMGVFMNTLNGGVEQYTATGGVEEWFLWPDSDWHFLVGISDNLYRNIYTIWFDGVKYERYRKNTGLVGTTPDNIMPQWFKSQTGVDNIWSEGLAVFDRVLGDTEITNIFNRIAFSYAFAVESAFVSDDEPNRIFIQLNKGVDTSIVPSTGDFAVSGGKTVTGVEVRDNLAIVTVNTAYVDTDTITVSYTQGANIITSVRKSSPDQLASFSNQAVTNNIIAGNAAYKFRRRAGNVVIPHLASYQGGDITISGFVQRDNFGTNGRIVHKKGVYDIYFQDNNRLWVRVYGNFGESIRLGQFAVIGDLSGSKIFFCLVYNQGTETLTGYWSDNGTRKDLSLASNAGTWATIGTTADDLYVGKRGDGQLNDYINLAGDARIWGLKINPIAANTTQVDTLMGGGSLGTEIGAWDFNRDASDSAGTNDGTPWNVRNAAEPSNW